MDRTLRWAPLIWPTALLGVFFAVPFAIMVAVSLFHRQPGGFFEPGFELTHYRRFLTPFFLERLGITIGIAAAAAGAALAIAVPFTYLLTRARRRTQVAWLIVILSVLSLSEVIVGFGWSVLLSRTAGISNLLVALGLLDRPRPWYPSLYGMITGLVYVTLPYAVLLLYPRFSRFDRQLLEAAETMGASAPRRFVTLFLPVMRPALIAALIMMFVFVLGAYVIPQVLGRAQHWTLAVLITDQALFQSNIPFAAAMAIFLLVVSLILVWLVLRLTRLRRA
jgi:putative spermidine/putrescine transport system permease protein